MMARCLIHRLVIGFGLGISLALIAGCASTASSPSLFVLHTGTPATHHANRPADPTLMIAPVATAAYLEHSGIVYQTGPHRVVVADHNRWASSLSDQLTGALYATLSKRLNKVNVVRASGNQQGIYKLHTRIDQFLGGYDGQAHIAGDWTLLGPDGKTVTDQAFSKTVPLKTDGYPALVSSLSTGWQSVGRDMAPALAKKLKPHSGSE